MGPMVADRRFGSGGARPTGCGWWFTGRRVAAADDPVIGHPRTLLIFLGAEVCACVQPAKTWSTWVLVAAGGWRRWCAGRPRRSVWSCAADSHWTHRLLAEHLREPLGISASQIGRILQALDVKPHRVRSWLNRPADPQFQAKAQAVCALYLNPPENTILLSGDEKTSMQAKSRKHPSRPIRPGRPERREFEYVRHGTVSLLA